MKKIFEQLLKATTAKEVTDILEILTEEHDIKWRPVGDRQNNQSTINMGTDPAAVQTPVKLTTVGRFKLTTPGRSKLTMLGRAKLTT
ncbi:MAG: hypothetical protein LCH51_16450 [Bacteroidetes bacterium]|nr:hypothetical protein [Bacteroidota bacterium]